MKKDEEISSNTEEQPPSSSQDDDDPWTYKVADKLMRIIDNFRDVYFLNLDEAVNSEVFKVSRIRDLADVDRLRILPTIHDAARCYWAMNWFDILTGVWVDPRFDWGRNESQPDGGEDAPQQEYALDASAILLILILSPFAFLMWLFILFGLAPTPSLQPAMSVEGIISVLGVLIILNFLRSLLHRLFPFTYLTYILGVECVLLIVAVRSVGTWASPLNDYWRFLHEIVPLKYRYILPNVRPGQVLLVVAWLAALGCVVRVHFRIVSYLGIQCSDGRTRPGYRAAAQLSSVLIIRFLDLSFYLSEWRKDIPDRASSDPKLIAARLPPETVRQQADMALAHIIRDIRKPWRQAMRAQSTPGRQIAEQMARETSRIERLVQYYRFKIVLGSANLIKLQEAMTTALVQSADGDWHVIGKEEQYLVSMAQIRWRVIARRLIAIAIPVVIAIGFSEFGRKLPAIYIQAILVTCIGFVAVQLLGLIDPDAPARLEIASKISSTLSSRRP